MLSMFIISLSNIMSQLIKYRGCLSKSFETTVAREREEPQTWSINKLGCSWRKSVMVMAEGEEEGQERQNR